MLDSALDTRDASAVAAVLRDAAAVLRDTPGRRGSTVFLPEAGSLVLTGDLHDHPLNAARLVKLADLARHPDRHLVLQELIHGDQRINDADLSIRTLARFAELVTRFPGRVHVLLSNHELAQYHGEQILKDGRSEVGAFNDGLAFLYGNDAETVTEAFNDWVRALPLAVRTPGGLFMSHSLPAPRRIEHFDKQVIDRDLTDEDLAPRGSAHDMVWGRHHNRTIVGELAAAWGVRAFALGHQPADMGYEPVADRALIINSDHDHGVALVVPDLTAKRERDDLIDLIYPLNAVRV